MIELTDRIIDDYGTVVFKDKGLLELIYREEDIHNAAISQGEEVNLYNKYTDKFGLGKPIVPYVGHSEPLVEYHGARQNEWNIPDEYKRIDLIEYFVSKPLNEEEQQRVSEELSMYFERGLENLLRTLIYLVDVMREHNIVWGVGRGSSVASYCLYLIGVHRINSIKYQLDIKEFLK